MPTQNSTSTVHRTEVGCVIYCGSSQAKLRRLIPHPQNEDFTCRIKFIKVSDGKKQYLTSGAGLPLLVRIQSMHEGKTGFYITGEIQQFLRGSFEGFGGNFNRYSDIIPEEWFKPGHEISLIHRGAALQGMIINVVNPSTGEKLRLNTTNL